MQIEERLGTLTGTTSLSGVNSNHFMKLKAGKNLHTVVSEARYRHFPAEIEFADWLLSWAPAP